MIVDEWKKIRMLNFVEKLSFKRRDGSPVIKMEDVSNVY